MRCREGKKRRGMGKVCLVEGLIVLRGSVLVLLGLGGEERAVDAGDDTTAGNGDVLEKLVELLVVTDGELDVTGDDADTLVVARGVSGELEDLSGEVLKDGSKVDGGSSSDTGGISSLTKLTVDTTDGELEASTVGAGLRLTGLLGSGGGSGGGLLGGHFDVCLLVGVWGVRWLLLVVGRAEDRKSVV